MVDGGLLPLRLIEISSFWEVRGKFLPLRLNEKSLPFLGEILKRRDLQIPSNLSTLYELCPKGFLTYGIKLKKASCFSNFLKGNASS
ncbi:hypothetical protein [Caldisericum sp.]|uniref:hypothetical protein n=1 Tax=Caldisericum sp. TaxID=2499687 RepID=UPI003D0C9298